ncbi:hypothetical protein QBC41DRAFT_389899 [Cercophora samala]|uniref:Uncharacterized protein n=1 Tax=Cercophora samala TaxID=330535 RepID=A0AA40DDS3_9PEZI|nr:hypothetical protein QBC41DRAFT_389899 [Cercophora samala]
MSPPESPSLRPRRRPLPGIPLGITFKDWLNHQNASKNHLPKESKHPDIPDRVIATHQHLIAGKGVFYLKSKSPLKFKDLHPKVAATARQETCDHFGDRYWFNGQKDSSSLRPFPTSVASARSARVHSSISYKPRSEQPTGPPAWPDKPPTEPRSPRPELTVENLKTHLGLLALDDFLTPKVTNQPSLHDKDTPVGNARLVGEWLNYSSAKAKGKRAERLPGEETPSVVSDSKHDYSASHRVRTFQLQIRSGNCSRVSSPIPNSIRSLTPEEEEQKRVEDEARHERTLMWRNEVRSYTFDGGLLPMVEQREEPACTPLVGGEVGRPPVNSRGYSSASREGAFEMSQTLERASRRTLPNAPWEMFTTMLEEHLPEAVIARGPLPTVVMNQVMERRGQGGDSDYHDGMSELSGWSSPGTPSLYKVSPKIPMP